MVNVNLRPFEESDWPELWPILQVTFATGDTYPFAPGSNEADIYKAWIETPTATYVACADEQTLLGTFYIKPNQPGLGSHVCNCGYVVAPYASGQGVATLMCEHSQTEALRLGFRAMQFNLVVSTNARAVRLWKHLGFKEVGVLPGAFNHARWATWTLSFCTRNSPSNRFVQRLQSQTLCLGS